MGLLEVMGVASILPFMQLMSDPQSIDTNPWLSSLYTFFEFSSHFDFLLSFGIGIMVIIGFSSIFSIMTVWLQYSYSWAIAHNLSTRLLKTYIHKPYGFFINTNTSKLTTYIIGEVGTITSGVLIPIIELFTRSFTALAIFALLLWVEVKIAVFMFLALGGAYLLLYVIQKKILRKIGKHRIEMNLLRYKSLQELMNGIKTITVHNQRGFFYNRFEEASDQFCKVQPKYNLLLAWPKYLLEVLAFGSILGITLFLFVRAGDIQSTIPRLSLYAVAGYRLLPALQRAFASAAKLRHNFPIVEKLYDDLLLSLEKKAPVTLQKTSVPFEKSIDLKQLSFSYSNSKQEILKNFNIKIEKGQTIAFCGSTGSGKTTLIDLIVGLLQPDEGQIEIDGNNLDSKSIKSWRDNLAYVPQDVFLFDDSILRNITMGKGEGDFDKKRLEKATKMADIFDFIQTELPQKFESKVGEKGVKLSGGQRQRIGLARALYSNPKVLILDEATSALDSITEKGIIESLKHLPSGLTTIIIAHRLSTVRHADIIYLLDQGKIVDKGSYQTLIKSNNSFKTMVELS